MKTGNILLPIDVNACPLEVFTFINQVAERQPVGITLLNVLALNVWVPENRLYLEAAREVEETLARLQRQFLPRLTARVCLRLGQPALQIVAEATESKSDLIVLTSRENRPRRNRFFHRPVLENVLKHAPCPVSLLRVRTRHDCLIRRRRMDLFSSLSPVVGRSLPGLGRFVQGDIQ